MPKEEYTIKMEQILIEWYMKTLTDKELIKFTIAVQTAPSFDLVKCNGFQEWLKEMERQAEQAYTCQTQIVTHISCNLCNNVLPPHTVAQHLDKLDPIHTCPHDSLKKV